jgi:DNA-directed RNA polymerase subunit RPC12/RpoP
MTKKSKKTEKCECPHCGSKDFYVHEFEYWKASVDEDEPNTINCWHKSSGIDLVQCAKCEADITELSLNPNFNFNFQ